MLIQQVKSINCTRKAQTLRLSFSYIRDFLSKIISVKKHGSHFADLIIFLYANNV